MKPVRWDPAAWNEAAEAAAFNEAGRTGGGKAFTDALWSAINLVREWPEAGAPFGLPIRRVVLHRFRYNLIYAPEPDAIFIIAVAHQRRAPKYWEGRI